VVVASGWSFEVVAVPGRVFDLGALGSVLAVVWIVGVTNAINLIDGLDGLASGVVAIIAASFLAYSLAYSNPFSVVLTAAMVGSCLGFLPHNWKPARIFMGDAGSLTLGYLLATMSVYGTLKAPAAVAVLVPILALGVPVFDTLLVMLVRFLERPKGRFFERFLRILHADRNHLHHLLESVVAEHRSVVRWIYGMVVVSCGMALVVALTKRSGLGFVLLGVEVVAVGVIRQLGLARQARVLSRRRRQELEQELHAEIEE
jgi:UDP-GlcNAc:undecaprenyl-phosphate GlcNAc-1-phosphate transferase